MDETKVLRFLAVMLEAQEDIYKRLFNLEIAHSALRDGVQGNLPPKVKEDCRNLYDLETVRYQDAFDNQPSVFVVRQAIAEIRDLLKTKS